MLGAPEKQGEFRRPAFIFIVSSRGAFFVMKQSPASIRRLLQANVLAMTILPAADSREDIHYIVWHDLRFQVVLGELYIASIDKEVNMPI